VPIAPVITESAGIFSLRDLDPGQYRLRVERDGYVSQWYGQSSSAKVGTTINLAEGQQLKDIVFRLISTVTVSGRITDARGNPVTALQVSLFETLYNTMGELQLSEVKSVTTDDRGDYRFFWVPSRRYIVGVKEVSGTSQGPAGNRFSATTYYPGTPSPSRAIVLETQPGADIRGINFVSTPQKVYRIRGRVIDKTTGRPPLRPQIWIGTQLETPTSGVLATEWTTNASYNELDGSFEFRNVIPGDYLVGSTMDIERRAPGKPSESAQPETLNSEYLPIHIDGADVDGVDLQLLPPLTIPIRLRVDGSDSALDLSSPSLNIRLEGISPISTTVSQNEPFKADGTGSIGNVSPGGYRIHLAGRSQVAYLKEANIEGVDVLNHPWEINNQTAGTLNILLGTRSGQIEGTLTDAAAQPIRGSVVNLVPDQGRDRPDLYRQTVTDTNGRFSFRMIPPGGYKLYSWEAIEENSWYQRGRPVEI
jgi:hypothetical protein